jgi:LysM repeat protein
MARKQVALIIGINAVISTVISVVVVLILSRPTTTTSSLSAAGVQNSLTSTAAMSATLESSPAGAPIIHVVQSGDTISGLALQYDVPADAIIATNQLKNPNFLQLGMELIIPIAGASIPTATFTPAPTVTDTPLPFEPPSAQMTAASRATETPLATPLPIIDPSKIEITEVVEPGDIDQEGVVLANTGAGLIDMQGWVLSDADGNSYRFARLTLWPGGRVTLHSRSGQDDPANLFWGKSEAVWTPGELARLSDASGQEIVAFTVGQ